MEIWGAFHFEGVGFGLSQEYTVGEGRRVEAEIGVEQDLQMHAVL